MMILSQSAPPAAVIGSKGWRDATVRSILRAKDVVRKTHVGQLESSTRTIRHSLGMFPYRSPQSNAYSGHYGVEKEHDESELEKKDHTRRNPTGTMFTSGHVSGPFPPPALREQSAVVSTGMAGDYMRGVREVEGHLRKQAARVTQEGTRLEHQRERLEKLLRGVRKALQVNQQSSNDRTFRPATSETKRDGADGLLQCERRELNVLKQELETTLRKTLTQQQALAESSRQLLDCAFERSRVTELLPQHGSLSAGVITHTSPLSLKPDPAGPFTPECKQALDCSASVLRESQQLREYTTQLMTRVIRKQTALHQSTSDALLKKITETVNLEQHLTLCSAATRQAIYRKQRQMQCARYSLSKALGPVCSADLFCRERLSRPMTQIYGRHSTIGLPESDLLTQGSFMLQRHIKSSHKELAELQSAHRLLEDDRYGKHAAVSVDSAVARLRRRLPRPPSVRPSTS
ncbi:coiled-coil domain-containing protein 105 [Triplophysa dalaica]|uniref:coiled-coil domain-containing protein 105 n=1 Tax=Triplophysa dalaica TaxID=1582913 RepID=UPI0024E01A39|nr:coiled-coil domain-containing protein 105 [Triplophysa dalaica]